MTRVTRLAPSPTGALHLGNARTFLINALLARQHGWKTILRIEDLDGPRLKTGADMMAISDLQWLGIQWDEGPSYQSRRATIYASAVQNLLESGRAYPCVCSRKEVELAASAPHADDGAMVYPGTCRGKYPSMQEAAAAAGRPAAVRFMVPEGRVAFNDAFAGRQEFEPATQLGDFVIQKADGTAAYQVAVVIDDSAGGVTNVVRGDDLIDSTPRQILLYQALGLAAQIPEYTHLPLVIGGDGRRLAKRHGDTRLSAYRAAGVPAGRILALLARWCGIEARPAAKPDDLLTRFRLEQVPDKPVIFTADDEAFLRGSG